MSNCKFHPAEGASWYCAHDGIHFCDDCIAVEKETEKARCFLCGRPAQQVGRTVAKEPFLTILSHFIEYPLNLVLMATAAAACIGLGLLPETYTGAMIAGVLGMILAGMGGAIIARTINGMMKPPEFEEIMKQEVWVTGLQQWLVFAVATFGIAWGYVNFGQVMGSGIALIVWLLVPAFIIEIQVGGSLINAFLGIGRIFGHMATIGVDYFYACGILFGLFTGSAILGSILHDFLPNLIAWPIAGLFAAWLWFSCCHLLGYLICQHREALGYSKLVSAAEARKQRVRRPEEERRLGVLLREGRYEKVVDNYKKQLDKKGGSLEFNESYERILQALGKKEEQIENASRFLSVLLKNEQEYRVVDLVKRYRAIDNSFKPDTAELTWEVAQIMAENEQPKLAVSLLQDLHKRSPTWPKLPQAYLFLAKILKLEFKLDNKAEQYVRFVEQRFHQPEAKKLIQEYRQQMAAGSS